MKDICNLVSGACAIAAIAATAWGATGTTPTTQSTKNIDIHSLFASPDSPGSVAIGVAEGTRTPTGGKTRYWNSHIDPGNGRVNQGTFSYQHFAASPEEADKKQIAKIHSFLSRLEKNAHNAGVRLNTFEIVAAADAFTQSEAAASDYLQNLINCRAQGKQGTEAVQCARVESFYEPSGRLNAPGLGNTRANVEADQRRRLEAIASAISPQSLFIHPAPGSTFTSGFYPCEQDRNCRIHPVWGTPEKHDGVDFANALGTPIRASQSGIVEIGETRCLDNSSPHREPRPFKASFQCGAGHGNHLSIHGEKYTSFYSHLDRILVSNGEFVDQGSAIATMGNSGASSGPHLHWGIREKAKLNWLDPQNFIAFDTSTEIYGRAK
ncbi:M23 family metallopeptidase [Kamptonema cortianum]|nr:M23 family metallopeptidase [Kamptonema cortianum]